MVSKTYGIEAWESNVMKNCYPGIARRWSETSDIRKNAYLNLLVYAGADITEEMLFVEMYTQMPFIENGILKGMNLDKEKKLAHVNCLYYEEFYNEDEQFQKVVLKKMKNRITSPVIYINAECFGIDGEEPIPCICCGYEDDQSGFIIVNPKTGEYEPLNNRTYHEKNNHKKMIMLNIPGMNRIHQISSNVSLNMAIREYRKQFVYYKDVLTWKTTGIEAMKQIDPNTLVDEAFVSEMINWIGVALSYKSVLDEKNVEFLDLLKLVFVELSNLNFDVMREYLDEIEQLSWE